MAHTNVMSLRMVTIIEADCPFAGCRVSFDATIWSPQVGMNLSGVPVANSLVGSS